MYYTKLKKLWDELVEVEPLPHCTSGSARVMAEITNWNKLMQFLMGLHDGYDQVQNQILLLDPLPTVNKAHPMILRVESQRQVVSSFVEDRDVSAVLAKNPNSHTSSRQDQKKGKGFKGHCVL